MTAPARFGKYQLIRRIGVGGMAEVYEAALLGPEGFQKRLALKLLLPRLQRQPELISMFIDEASIAASLDHPNIVAVFEFGEIEGTYFMAMEYVDGWELADVEQCCQEVGRPLPVNLCAHVVRELCRGLSYIHGHERGIVHRDVTPHNVFISRVGQVKLADFGIAKAAARRTHTEAGHIKGKLAYLAPEQATGEPVTARTDVYAAGLILFELLTGRRLIEAATEVRHITMAMNPPRVSPSSLRAEAAPLDAIVARALERHPVMRYPGAEAMASALERYLETAPARSEDLAAFVSEVTASARPPAGNRSPLPAVDVPASRGAPAAGAATPRVHSRPAPGGARVTPVRSPAEPVSREPTSPSLSALPRNRLGLWLGGGLLACGLLALGATLLWSAGQPRLGTGSRAALESAAPPPPGATGRDARLAGARPAPPEAGGPRVAQASPPDARAPRARSPRKRPRPGQQPSAKLPPASPDARAPAQGPSEPGVAQLQRLQAALGALQREARGRGLHPGDDSEADAALGQTRRALQSRALAEAESALARLRGRVQQFQIDRDFAERKLRRLERAIAARHLPEAERRRMATLSQAILRLIMEGRLVEASSEMSRALAALAAR